MNNQEVPCAYPDALLERSGHAAEVLGVALA